VTTVRSRQRTAVPERGGPAGADDVPAVTDPSLVGRLVAHGQPGFFTISVIDAAAIGIAIGALVAANQAAAPDHLPFLVASFASSVVVLFSLPGLDIAAPGTSSVASSSAHCPASCA
jgi:hypothetical protein